MPPESQQQIACYLRISEDRDLEALGIERQRNACHDLAARHGLSVTDEYVDNNVSAYTGKARDAFTRLLSAMSAGRVAVVLAYAPDRIARNLGDYAAFTDTARVAGVRVILVNGGEVAVGDPTSTLSSGVQALVSSWESGIKSVRVKAAAEQRALAGAPPNGPRKYGYTLDHMTIVEHEAEQIRTAVQAVLSGQSLRSQVMRINALGEEFWTPERKGRNGVVERRPWQSTAMRRLLARPGLAGIVTYLGTEHRDVVAQWPSILTVAEHDELIVMLASRTSAPNGGPGRPAAHLLTGIAKCGVEGCDGTMGTTRATRPGGRALQYRCRYAGDRQPRTRTSHVSRLVSKADNRVTAAVVARLGEGDIQSKIAEQSGEDTAGLVAERERARQSMNEVAEAVAAGAFTPGQAATMNKGFMSRLDDLDEKIAAADRTGVLQLVAEITDPVAWWEGADLETRRAVVSALVEVTIMPTGRGPSSSDDDIVLDWLV